MHGVEKSSRLNPLSITSGIIDSIGRGGSIGLSEWRKEVVLVCECDIETRRLGAAAKATSGRKADVEGCIKRLGRG